MRIPLAHSTKLFNLNMARIVKSLVFLLLTGAVCSFLVPDGKVSVHSPVGEIVGFSEMISINGSQQILNKFLGIPYAEPPTGVRRLRKPVPKPAFKTAFDASEFGSACYQFSAFTVGNQSITYSEDCLFLNIFVPGHLHANINLYPVMIWIHGGAFVTGSSNVYDFGPLSLSGDVIVVTINYRLNVFGFLSTNDPNAGGNFGLWDQHLAIKWVHDNIHAFGGDPNRVTIFGESAGSASVAYQAIHPGNQGLFQRAIAQSGSFSSPWAFTEPADARNITKQFAALAGCSQQDDASLVNCLQSKSGKDINDTLNGPGADQGLKYWTPVIDGKFVLDNPKKILTGQFPSKHVKDMFLSVDLIMGVNNKEGFVMYGAYNKSTELDYNKTYIDEKLIPEILRTYEYPNDFLLASVKAAAALEYTDWQNLDDDNKQFERYIDFLTDYLFHVSAAQTAQRHTIDTTKHTYVYELSAAPPHHLLPVFSSLDAPTVANHADDLSFLMQQWIEDNYKGAENENITDEQRKIGLAMITMWANFAKTG